MIDSVPAGLEVYRDSRNEWRWRAVAANGQRVATSGEGYINRRDAIHGAIVAGRILGDPHAYLELLINNPPA